MRRFCFSLARGANFMRNIFMLVFAYAQNAALKIAPSALTVKRGSDELLVSRVANNCVFVFEFRFDFCNGRSGWR
jgi:hypothetical protein